MSNPAPNETPLAEELRTFEANRASLLGAALGKHALIYGSKIIGTYESERDAIAEGYRRCGNVPFLVKRIVAVEEPHNFVSNLICI